ncbi:hypothetical protein SCM07_14685, partial [Legionella pneumophila serogroup 1]
MDVKKELNFDGEFWIPSDKKKIQGKLTIYNDGKISLHLDDLIQNPSDINIIPTIFGRLNNSKLVTLTKSYVHFNLGSQVVAMIAYSTEQKYSNKLSVNSIIIGNNYIDTKNIKLVEGNFHLNYEPSSTKLPNIELEIKNCSYLTVSVEPKFIKCKLVNDNGFSMDEFLHIVKI